MWIDADGRMHTVALPEPRECLGARLRAALRAADQRAIEEALQVLDDIEESIYERPTTVVGVAGQQLPPQFYPAIDDSSIDLPLVDLFRRTVLSVPEEWQLDVAMVLQDSAEEELESRG